MPARAATWVVPAAISVATVGGYAGSFLVIRARFSQRDEYAQQFVPFHRHGSATWREARVFSGSETTRRILSIAYRPCMLLDEHVTPTDWTR